MRSLLTFVAAVMALLALLGCVYVAFGGIGVYMVVSGAAVPGEPMFLDELTPTLADSVLQTGIGIALIAGALTTRTYVRRVMARMNDNRAGGAGNGRRYGNDG